MLLFSIPNCRCCVVPYIGEEMRSKLMRFARTKDGKPIKIKYKTFEEWAKDNL